MADHLTDIPSATRRPGQVRVAIVDDSIVIRDRLSASLGRMPGVSVVGEAPDAQSGLALVSREHPDVLILDVRMPNGGGFRLLRDIRDLQPRPTTVVLTNYSYAAHRKRSLELGAQYFFDKSIEFERVRDVIHALQHEVET